MHRGRRGFPFFHRHFFAGLPASSSNIFWRKQNMWWTDNGIGEFGYAIGAVPDLTRVKVMCASQLALSCSLCWDAHLLRFLSNWMWLNGSLFSTGCTCLHSYQPLFICSSVHLSLKNTNMKEKKYLHEEFQNLIFEPVMVSFFIFYIFYCQQHEYHINLDKLFEPSWRKLISFIALNAITIKWQLVFAFRTHKTIKPNKRGQRKDARGEIKPTYTELNATVCQGYASLTI